MKRANDSDGKRLSSLFSVRERFCRSVNLRLDWQSQAQIDGYLLTRTAHGLAKRIASSAISDSHPRAWSITGPYGSGKSAFALFLTELLAKTSPTHPDAKKLRLDIELGNARLFPLLVVGQRAPLGRTLLEGIARSVVPLSRQLASKALRAARGSHPESQLVPILQQATSEAKKAGYSGTLFIIDELGKFLEHAAVHEEGSDFFVLQEVAELAARSKERPLLIVTILHTAFSEYVGRFDATRRSEWQKIQGRFADVAFQEPAEQFLRLVGNAIERRSDSPLLARAKSSVSQLVGGQSFAEARSRLPLNELLSASLPLHPLTALLLWPIFRNKLAQNERSLFAFLASREPLGFQDFLGEPLANEISLYRLDRLYDYIVHVLGEATYRGERARRWGEIDHALSRIPSDAPQMSHAVVKTVGVLGLYGSSVGLRPTTETICLALGDHHQVDAALAFLKDKSILVFRKHDQSYGLWEGSDIDLDALYEQALNHIQSGFLSARIKKLITLQPVVARSHYIKTGTLRYFPVDVIDGSTESLEQTLSRPLSSDGSITYVLSPTTRDRQRLIDSAIRLTAKANAPLRLLAFPRPIVGLELVLREAEAWSWIGENEPRLQGDPVARQEVRSRYLIALENLHEVLGRTLGLRGSAFEPRNSDWINTGSIQQDLNAKEFLQWLSDLCGKVFKHSPRARNELLNRDHLSSQAAAARRNLLERMLASSDKENLGIVGYPPELSMYMTMLRMGGFHSQRGGLWGFDKPHTDWQRTWDAIDQFLADTRKERRPINELFRELKAPPFGLREGPLPVLLCCCLLAKRDSIALYELGVFVPDLRIEVLERLLRAPDQFEIQEHAIGKADREVLAALNRLLGSLSIGDAKHHSPNILHVVKPLVLFAARLPQYARQTKRISDPVALKVRDAILSAKDPYALIFREIPNALGTVPDSPAQIQKFVSRLADVLRTLQRAYPQLLDEVESQLRVAFGVSGTAEAVRKQLKARALPLLSRTVDPTLNVVVRELANIGDRDWREVLGIAICRGLPPSQWQDVDAVSFHVRLAQVAKDFIRLEELVGEQLKTGASEILRVGILNGQARESRAIISVDKQEAKHVVALASDIEKVVSSMRTEPGAERIALAALANVVLRLLSDRENEHERKSKTKT